MEEKEQEGLGEHGVRKRKERKGGRLEREEKTGPPPPGARCLRFFKPGPHCPRQVLAGPVAHTKHRLQTRTQ